MTFQEILKKSVDVLKKAGIETPVLDAEVIIAHAADIERHRIIIDGPNEVAGVLEKKITSLIKRRAEGVPVAYLTGEREFYSLSFTVNEHVLIPRPETELLVDMAVYYAPQNGRVLDLGTGSGCIAAALKYSRKDLKVSASDVSEEALNTAIGNSNLIFSESDIDFRCGDLFEPWKGELFDVIISNPPYIDPAEADNLDLSCEPSLALYCDKEGLSVTRKLIEEAEAYLSADGIIILEIGSNMKDFILELGGELGYHVSVLNDYSGLPRVATLRKPE